jgi:antitoxin PrlF
MQVLEEVSSITSKGQTTVPKSVRQVLGVDCGGEIAFRVENGMVTVHAVEAKHEDPAMERFLALLARDIEERPEAVKSLSREFSARMASITKDKQIDLKTPIEGLVDL